ncbi:MAG: hypothetical protein Q7R65_04035 [bacterium]|nr:hypothetical protein [bacterium]
MLPINPRERTEAEYMRQIEMDFSGDLADYRDRMAMLQELFLKLDSQDESGIIAIYQTAKSLDDRTNRIENWSEHKSLQKIRETAEARMLEFVTANDDKVEKRLLIEKFKGVLNNWSPARDVWERCEIEEKEKTRVKFWDKLYFWWYKKKTARTERATIAIPELGGNF